MTYTMKDIDVFILAHERTTLLAETIDSVLRNTVLPTKITVLDNDSEQDVKQVVDGYAAQGVEYVRTHGRHGNYYKAKELASREFIIRLHDDNLIHPEFFEKILFALNNINNLSAVSTNHVIFVSGSDKTRPEEFPKDYVNPQHLENGFFIITSPEDYVKHNVNSFSYNYLKGMSPCGTSNKYYIDIYFDGIPFILTKTKLFKDYSEAYDKYSKNDDWDFFLYLLKNDAYIAFCTDPRCAYIRAHKVRDSETDDNSLTFEQLENWVTLLVSQIKDVSDEEFWVNFFGMIYVFYGKIVKKSLQLQCSPYQFISNCYDKGILPECSKQYFETVPDLTSWYKKKKVIKTRPLSTFEKIFSIVNEVEFGKKKKILTFLGQRFNLTDKKAV